MKIPTCKYKGCQAQVAWSLYGGSSGYCSDHNDIIRLEEAEKNEKRRIEFLKRQAAKHGLSVADYIAAMRK